MPRMWNKRLPLPTVQLRMAWMASTPQASFSEMCIRDRLKAIIQEVSGLACGIGPYTPPKDQATDHPTVEQALKDLENHGVDVVYKDKE